MELEPYESAYKQLAEDPERWISSARNLLAASDRLWLSVRADFSLRRSEGTSGGGDHADVAQSHTSAEPYLQHAAVYLMVAGFAIENALKAVRVKQDRAIVGEAKKAGTVGLSREILTHDLQRLAKEVGVMLSDSERNLLERLQAYLVWAGRYPVAVTAKGQAAVQLIWESDQEVIAGFFVKVETMFQAA